MLLKSRQIKKYAAEAGFDLCGVARARVLVEHTARYEAALAVSGSGGLEYLARDYGRRMDPARLLPGARTVVVCALAYDGTAARDGVASFALQGEDYHLRVKTMLRELLGVLRRDHPALCAKVCCDTSAILEKAWAVEAGLGWQGRNSLLINPHIGSFSSLGELILDGECDTYDEPCRGDGCGDCRACEAACPVGAIGEAAAGDGSRETVRVVDTAKCISARTIEKTRLHPDEAPRHIHGWVWGCDECQTVCPHNRWQRR